MAVATPRPWSPLRAERPGGGTHRWLILAALALGGALGRPGGARAAKGLPNTTDRHTLNKHATALIGTWSASPRRVHFTRVIFGDGAVPAADFNPASERFDWPEDLLPDAAAGGAVVAILGEGKTTLVPVRSLKAPKVKTVEDLRELLVRELLAEQASEPDQRRREEMIHLATPLLAADDAKPLLPLLKNQDEWLRRLALAAVIDATRADRYVQMGAKDLSDFLASRDLSGTVSDAGETFGAEWRLLGYAYAFLDMGSPDDANAAFLPLYRAVAARARGGMGVERFGISPLAQVGTRSDLPLIYSYHDNKSATVRWQVRAGVARILHLELKGGEEQEDAAVRAALGKQGIH